MTLAEDCLWAAVNVRSVSGRQERLYNGASDKGAKRGIGPVGYLLEILYCPPSTRFLFLMMVGKR